MSGFAEKSRLFIAMEISAPMNRELEKALFDAATELTDGSARNAFLERACNGDPVLRTRLEKLLAVQSAIALQPSVQHDAGDWKRSKTGACRMPGLCRCRWGIPF